MPASPTAAEQIAALRSEVEQLSALRAEVQELNNAIYILANEQLNQSGGKPKLVTILRRYAPDRQETRPAQLSEQRAEMSG
jgi:hypothetical protein